VQGGRVIGTISQPSGGLGLRIDGELNQPVFAAAGGRSVYTGSGLRGYGQLIIITHERGWLSAYGHNALVHVQEGETVRAGQAIAAM
jgi:lipoprotein NlpD